MTSFAPAAALPRVVPPDPTKHVNFTRGMILGVDDFVQESTYRQGRMRWLTRDLIGFGTVWGLAVTFAPSDTDVVVSVSPGVAVSPCGELVCVSPTQCASLNRWLGERIPEVLARLGSTPEVGVSVVLCYRECLTDDVPIPGEPCRATSELMAPSRVKDDFRLELRLDPPEQPDEEAIVDLVRWLERIPVVAGPGTPLDEFAATVREAIQTSAHRAPPASPLEGPPLLLGSPPATLEIPADDVARYLRTALRVWVTEGGPLLHRCGPDCECGCAGGCGCADAGTPTEPCEDDALLLGELRLTLELPAEGGIRVAPDGWALDESKRPFLLSTRLLQELILGESVGLARASSSPPVVAGARVDKTGNTEFAYGGLQVEKVDDSLFRLYGWPGAATPYTSVVTGTPIGDGAIDYVFELVEPGPVGGAHVYVKVGRVDGQNGTTGFGVQITDFSGMA